MPVVVLKDGMKVLIPALRIDKDGFLRWKDPDRERKIPLSRIERIDIQDFADTTESKEWSALRA